MKNDALPVGEILAEEIALRGWTQLQFARILGRPAQFVSDVKCGRKGLTVESAAQVGAALNTSAELWLMLQSAYRLRRLDDDVKFQTQLEHIRQRAGETVPS